MFSNLLNCFNKKPEFLVFSYFFVFISLFLILYQFNILTFFPSDENLLHWDANWYKSIVDTGYVFNPDSQSNVAFFPLFPYLWKFLGLNAWQISLFNFFLFLFSLSYLFRAFSFSFKDKLFFLCSSTLIFCFLPYAESLFFFFSLLLIIGLTKNNFWLICLGFLGAGLSRSAIVIFIPALFVLLVMNFKHFKRKDFIQYSIYFLVLAITIGITASIQYSMTGEAFGFQQTQIHWKHFFRIPIYPLHSKITMVFISDVSSLIFGLFCGIELLILFLNSIKAIENRNLATLTNVHLFSLSYVFAISCFVLFFQGGNLNSLNRYVMGTIFFLFVYDYVKLQGQKTFVTLLIVSIALCHFSGLFLGYGHFYFEKYAYLKFLLFFPPIIFCFYFLNSKMKHANKFFLLCCLLCFLLQFYYYHSFLAGSWVG